MCVILVNRDADGVVDVQQATDHSARSGLTWALVDGMATGVLWASRPRILMSRIDLQTLIEVDIDCSV